MEKYDVVLNMNGVRKVAFAAGFGLFMGKEVANAVSTVAWTMFGKSLVRAAKKTCSRGGRTQKFYRKLDTSRTENSKEDE